ncbi:class I SAM-dependent RNA methyltransferase [bacterium]|nr:class I SAM-dependent RNA methyltransferase [bacterium]
MGEPVELLIADLAAGGDGVGRLDGRAVFVPGAVPGDRLRVRLSEEHSRWARAELLAVLAPGAARVAPPCPVAGECGGCQWQQVHPQAQRAARQAVVEAALRRIAGLAEWPAPVFAPTPAPFDYRRRAEYRLLGAGGGRLALGFLARGSHRLVEHERCLLLEPALAEAVSALRAHLAGRLRRPLGAEVELTLLGGAPAPALQLVATVGDAGREGRELAAALAAWAPPGLAVHWGLRDREDRWLREPPGAPYLLEQVELAAPDGRRLSYPLHTRPGEFVQANRAANRQLLEALLAELSLADAPWVLDLYCGAGNLSLPLALSGARVLGIESRRSALRSARKSAREARAARARFRAGRVAELLPVLAAEGRQYRSIVLDPPRQGAPELAAWLDPLGVQEILAVSCHPATFARDLQGWCARGFRLESLRLFDFFPQTHHVELLARLSRA